MSQPTKKEETADEEDVTIMTSSAITSPWSAMTTFWNVKKARDFTYAFILGLLGYEMFFVSFIVEANIYLHAFFTLKQYILFMPLIAFGFVVFAPRSAIASWKEKNNHEALLKMATLFSLLGAVITFVPTIPWHFFLQWMARSRVSFGVQLHDYTPDPVMAGGLILAGLLAFFTAIMATPWFIIRFLRIEGYKHDDNVDRLETEPKRFVIGMSLLLMLFLLLYVIDLTVSSMLINPSSLLTDPVGRAIHDFLKNRVLMIVYLESLVLFLLSLFFYWDARRILPTTTFVVMRSDTL